MRHLILTLAFLASTQLSAATSKVFNIPVKGMVCSSCEEKITETLLKLPGVTGVVADHSEGKAIITLDSKAKTTEAELKAAIRKAGFKVEG